MTLQLNQITVSGRLNADSETRSTQTGRLVTSFGIFVTYRLTRDQQTGEWQEDGFWMDVEKWEPQNGQPRQYLKGQEVVVTGKMREVRFQTRDGQEARRMRLVADIVREVTKPQNAGQQNAGGYGQQRQAAPAPQSSGYGQPPPYNPPPVNGTYPPKQAAPKPQQRADAGDIPRQEEVGDDLPF